MDTWYMDIKLMTLPLAVSVTDWCMLGNVPDMVGASPKALLPTQGDASGVHEVAKELPPGWHLEHLHLLLYCHSKHMTC